MLFSSPGLPIPYSQSFNGYIPSIAALRPRGVLTVDRPRAVPGRHMLPTKLPVCRTWSEETGLKITQRGKGRMEESKRQEIEEKLRQLIQLANRSQQENRPTSPAPLGNPRVIRRRKGEPDLQIA